MYVEDEVANVCGYSKGKSVKDKVEIYIWNTGGCLKRMKCEKWEMGKQFEWVWRIKLGIYVEVKVEAVCG